MKLESKKTGWKSFLTFFIVVSVFTIRTGSLAEEGANFVRCLDCHRGIEKISPRHDFQCSACHIPPELRSSPRIESHDLITRNPSDPSVVRIYCIACHKDEIETLESSLHGTLAGIINQTRYLWGAQERAVPGSYGLSGPFQTIAEPGAAVYPENPTLLVDDFLRRRCLRCHIHVDGQPGRGLFRASGCAACHVLYADDGRYRGGDRALQDSPEGYPERHQFTRDIPTFQCLHCHNQNHVGTDFVGLFERDYSTTYRVLHSMGRSPEIIYGMGYHHLSKDIHAEKGMWCINCHRKADVMGNGHAYDFQMAVPRILCTDCHGGFAGEMPDEKKLALQGIALSVSEKEQGTESRGTGAPFIFTKRGSGQSVTLPLFKKSSPGHNIEEHSGVRCSACHAQWSFQDYGLSVIREDVIEGRKWIRLRAQGDMEIERILTDRLIGEGGDILSRDRISGRYRLGIWLQGWRFRRWEFMPLGKDQRGRVSILRPLYQYLISYVDKLGHVALDSEMPTRGDGSGRGWQYAPYVPHTIAPAGRSCDSCHRNRSAAGLGIRESMTKDTRLTVPSPPAVGSMRLLNQAERKKLMHPSERWKRERFKSMSRSHDTKE